MFNSRIKPTFRRRLSGILDSWFWFISFISNLLWSNMFCTWTKLFSNVWRIFPSIWTPFPIILEIVSLSIILWWSNKFKGYHLWEKIYILMMQNKTMWYFITLCRCVDDVWLSCADKNNALDYFYKEQLFLAFVTYI